MYVIGWNGNIMSKLTDLEQAEETQIEEHYDDLASFVMYQFERARRHRDSIGLTNSIIECLRRYRSKYSDDEKAKFEGIEVYRGATSMLCRSAYNWLKDAYFNAQDKPWTLEPTPIPELPESIQKELDETIAIQIQQQILQSSANGINKIDQDMISKLKNTASKLAFESAAESVKAMENLISDQLIEAGFRDVLAEFLLDVVVYPYAVLKGPVVKYKEIPVWNGNKYKFKKEPRYYLERVDPLNFFVSPDSSNCQDGEFVIELMPTSLASLNASRKLKGFMEDAIDLIIYEQGSGTSGRNASVSTLDSETTELDGIGKSSDKTEGYMFDVYEYNGRISGENIISFLDDMYELDEALHDTSKTVDTPWGEIDPYDDYECTIRVCNDVVIMARLNEINPVPYRNYYATSCFKIPGSFAGESIPLVIADEQDELNMAARARYFNMGMSSGPIAEADQSRFPDNVTPDAIEPWNVYPVTTNTTQGNNSAPAIRFTDIPNYSSNFTAVMEEIWDKMHRISGIPPYMYGDNRGSAQTLGAFSLQYAGATKGIKTIISNIDNDIIEKFIQQLYYYNMVYYKDASVKSDAKVNVRGSAGLIAQEQRQSRPLELLQALGPVLAQLDPQKALALANETLSESGYDPATFGTNVGNAQEEAAARQIGIQQPQVDGRSAPAVNAAQTANLPPQM